MEEVGSFLIVLFSIFPVDKGAASVASWRK